MLIVSNSFLLDNLLSFPGSTTSFGLAVIEGVIITPGVSITPGIIITPGVTITRRR